MSVGKCVLLEVFVVSIKIPDGYRPLPSEAFANEALDGLLVDAFTWIGKSSSSPATKEFAALNIDAVKEVALKKALDSYLPCADEIETLLSDADCGNVKSMVRIGCYYYWEALLSRQNNFPESIFWFEKAAECGDIWSQVTLSILYCYDDAPWSNEAFAAKWSLIAASAGDESANFIFSQLKSTLKEDVLGAAKEMGKDWFNSRMRMCGLRGE